MIEILLPEDLVWYGACYRYATGPRAREVWEAVGELNKEGSWHVGIYRHQRIGLDKEPVLVSVVGSLRDGVAAAEGALIVGKGIEIELHHATWLHLVVRRVEMVQKLQAEGAPEGHYRIRDSQA